ncbi:MAG: DEAD/DEAH box helicase [Candidatus Hadarchaeota archaeon]
MDEKGAYGLLAKPIQKILLEKGFTKPTLPQEKAIPEILDGKNVLLIAPAGTGKTEAAFLPVLHQLLVSGAREPGIKVIYITPLRALNRDMLERLQWWCGSLDLRVSVRHGDTAERERRTQALVPPDVMITTPETLQILLLGRRLSGYLRSIRWVVVDEVHELSDNERGAQLSLSLERLRELKGGDFQLIGLSATIGSPEEVAKFLAGVGRHCKVVDVSVAREIKIDVVYPQPSKADERLATQIYTFPQVAARLRKMRELVEKHRSTLIFTNTRPTAEVLGSRFRLWDINFPITVHHGSLSSFTRERAERMLKAGELRAIVCTSSMELGLDIGAVDLVIQHNSPRQVTRLLQRVGRSGHRIGEVSKGVIVVQDSDDALESLVIASRSRQKELEPVSIPEKPLDVLLHSLVSYIVAGRGENVGKVLEVFKRAYPFRNLSRDEVVRALSFAQSLEQRLVKVSVDGKTFERSGPSQRVFEYYFGNLSMIPEFKQYMVVDDEGGKPVGILDESFIAEYGEPGVKFVMGGELWRVIQVFKDKVYVKNERDPLGAIPTWIGEEIPVPLSVAQEVGLIRGTVEEGMKGGTKFEDVVAVLSKKLEASRETLTAALKEARKQSEDGLLLPTNRRVTVEKVKDVCVVNCCFGTLANRAIARLISHKASAELGFSVATSVDPYRVLLRSSDLEPDKVLEILTGKLGGDFRRDLRQVIEESRFFRWRLAQVARKMGILRKDVELTSTILDKLTRSLKGTPAFEEAFEEVARKDLDLGLTLELLGKMANGEIEVVSFGVRKSPTPVSELAWRQRYLVLEPTAPGRMKILVMASAKARLLSEVRAFACVECRKYFEEIQVNKLDEEPKCPVCGSGRLGMAEERVDDVRWGAELAGRGKITPIWKQIVENSKLISRYGKPAVVALVGRGVGHTAAEQILALEPRLTNRFFELVVRKERESVFRKFKWSG